MKYLKHFESFSGNESKMTVFTDEEELEIRDSAGSKVSVEFKDGYLIVNTDSGSIQVFVEKTTDTKDGSDKYIVRYQDANITTHSKRELFAFSIEEIGQCLQTITSQHSKDKSKYDEFRSKF